MESENNAIETNPFEHIIYEFSMYLQASLSHSPEQFLTNLFVDSRMVHMRNLAYFFCSEKIKRSKYFHYTDYISERLSNEIDKKLLDEIQQVTSNSTCHVQKGRLSASFKKETAILEQKVFPIFVLLIKGFIAKAKTSIRSEYKCQWQDERIQGYVNGLEQLITNMETKSTILIVAGTTGV